MFIDGLNAAMSQEPNKEDAKKDISESELIDLIKQNKSQGRKSVGRPAPKV